MDNLQVPYSPLNRTSDASRLLFDFYNRLKISFNFFLYFYLVLKINYKGFYLFEQLNCARTRL